jgi:NADH-quinone oxidoreductase subunit C
MLTFDQLFDIVKVHCSKGEATREETATPKAVRIDPNDLVPVCTALYSDPRCYFDMLSCVTGIDNGPEANTMEVAFNLYSIPFNHHLMIKVILPRTNPEVETLTSIWKSADWQEREVFDMYGIKFLNHPDLRRILLPADWEGYPLRKDYKHQEYYRNIKVEY